MRFPARPFPFVENPSPHRAENNDARHVQCPRGKVVFAHLRCAHGVKEELKIPTGARERGEQVVATDGDLQVSYATMRNKITRTVFAPAGATVVPMVLANVRGEILIGGMV